jgi:hypothetical protein
MNMRIGETNRRFGSWPQSEWASKRCGQRDLGELCTPVGGTSEHRAHSHQSLGGSAPTRCGSSASGRTQRVRLPPML